MFTKHTPHARKPPKVPVTVHSRHPVNLGDDGMVPSGAARHLQHTTHSLQCIVIWQAVLTFIPHSCYQQFEFLISGIELLISAIRIVDRPTSNSNCWYQQFDFLISTISIVDISIPEFLIELLIARVKQTWPVSEMTYIFAIFLRIYSLIDLLQKRRACSSIHPVYSNCW